MLVKIWVMVRHLETASLLAPFKTYILFFPAYIFLLRVSWMCVCKLIEQAHQHITDCYDRCKFKSSL